MSANNSAQADSVSGRKKKKKKKKKFSSVASGITLDNTQSFEKDMPVNIFCDPCKNVYGKNISAEAFCTDCFEYLCISCSDYHTKLAATKEHVLQSKENMPKDKSKVKVKDKCLEKCPSHPDKITEYFCRDCNETGCNVCVTLDHRDCSKVDYIASIVTDLEESREFKDFKDLQSRLMTELESMQNTLRINKNKKEVLKEAARTAIKQQKDEIKSTLEKWECENLVKLEERDKEYECKLNSASKQQCTMASELQSMTSNLEQKVQNSELCELFITMKKDKKKLVKLIQEFQLLQKYCKLSSYQYEPSKQSYELMVSPEFFGTLTQTKSEKKRTPKYRKTFTVKSKKDTYSNWVSSVCVISENILVAADSGSKLLKVINVNTGDIIFMLNVPVLPAGITKIADDEIAVTIKQEHKIMFLTVGQSGVLNLKREIEVDGECMGIAYTNNKLILTMYQPRKVEIVDMDGIVLKSFSADMDEYKFLKTPSGLAVGKNRNIFYVSDNMEDIVTCMTLDGVIIATYRDIGLREPWDMAVDESGSVYVCCGMSANVHQLSEDCTKVQIFQDRGPGPPARIDYCEKSKRLYIGMLAGEHLNVYDLE